MSRFPLSAPLMFTPPTPTKCLLYRLEEEGFDRQTIKHMFFIRHLIQTGRITR